MASTSGSSKRVACAAISCRTARSLILVTCLTFMKKNYINGRLPATCDPSEPPALVAGRPVNISRKLRSWSSCGAAAGPEQLQALLARGRTRSRSPRSDVPTAPVLERQQRAERGRADGLGAERQPSQAGRSEAGGGAGA